MDWKNLREKGGQNVQEYTQEFKKRALTLNVPLYMQENILKYIGRLHSYLRHIVLMLNPNSLLVLI